MNFIFSQHILRYEVIVFQPAFTCSMLRIETLEQGGKNVQS